ncbi:MAG: hypothetical protein BM556_05895 [Bacteriovorax sp. MedPE-SWde]|nr:MAG: hypothetical protein BM556_05895 [Bacteriovorax sp. MedPE-SWde]
MFFKSPQAQWQNILTKPLKQQTKFLNKVCKVNRRDALVIREAFFDNLSFDLVRDIFKLVNNVVDSDGIDPSFRELIFDRLFGVLDIEHLYPEDEEDDNVISGDGYHVYTANYHDLDLIVDFVNSCKDIKSICDLGSGSGRALLYMALEMNRELNYLGLELVNDRVEFTNDIAQKFSLENLKFKTCNFLSQPDMFEGFDAYYFYDPVGTDDVPKLISLFQDKISKGESFYILFISGWDDIMLNALNDLKGLEKLSSTHSRKQDDRFVSFYKSK